MKRYLSFSTLLQMASIMYFWPVGLGLQLRSRAGRYVVFLRDPQP